MSQTTSAASTPANEESSNRQTTRPMSRRTIKEALMLLSQDARPNDARSPRRPVSGRAELEKDLAQTNQEILDHATRLRDQGQPDLLNRLRATRQDPRDVPRFVDLKSTIKIMLATLDSATSTNIQWQQRYQALTDSERARTGALEEAIQRAQEESKAYKRATEARIADLQKEHTAKLQQAQDSAQALALSFKESIKQVERKFLAESSLRESNTLLHAQEVAELKSEHEARNTELENQIVEYRSELEKSHIDANVKLEKQAADNFAALEYTWYQRKEEGACFKVETDALKVRIANLQTELKRQMDHAELELESRNQAMQLRHSEEICVVERKFEKRIKYMQRRYDEAQQRHLEELDALGKALIERDNLESLPMGKITSIFAHLATEIDQIARDAWSSAKARELWTDDTLKSVSSNVRRLKKSILQDYIWGTLFGGIFYGPFTVFGSVGLRFAQEWYETFNLASDKPAMESKESLEQLIISLPNATVDSERWRSGKVQGCYSILTEPAEQWEEQKRSVKKGFKQSRSRLRKSLLAMFDDMDDRAPLLERLDEIIDKAADFWIQCGTQRYRIVMTLPGNSVTSMADNVELARQGKLNLTTLPRLLRYGNQQGQALYESDVLEQGSVERVCCEASESLLPKLKAALQATMVSEPIAELPPDG